MGKQTATWLGITLIIILGVGGIIALSNTSQPANTSKQSSGLPPISKQDIQVSTPSAKVTLIEYADFQCPSCRYEYPSVKKLMSEYKGKLNYVYRFFPLLQVHKNSMVAAEAGYAAYKQNKFWEMQDKLFTNQQEWADTTNATDYFVKYATNLKLNVDQFKKDMKESGTDKFINDEENAGVSAGVNATPTFYLNGEKLANNPQSYEEFKGLIDSKLNAK